MVDWLPGVQHLPGDDGGAQDTRYPPRLVLHTTEGSGTVSSFAKFYGHTTYWPHFTADPRLKQLAQHLPFSRAGRALSHTTSTETNKANCIQVEIIGYARDAAGWPTDQVDWLGRALAPVFDALTIPRKAPAFVANGAGLNAAQRMSEAAWRAFSGVCGHEHVPENDHYDPGAFNVTRFLSATFTQPPKELDMTEDELRTILREELAKLLGGASTVPPQTTIVGVVKHYTEPLATKP